jgi:DNA polymerase-3 subunit delta
MIIFLYGEDSYRSGQKLTDIIEGYKKVHKSGLNLIYINAKEKDFDDFYANFKINSMFAEKKLIVLKNIFNNTKFQEALLDNIDNLEKTDDIVVIYENEKADKRTKLFKKLEKISKCQEFNFLQPIVLRRWIVNEFEKNNSKIDNPALELLIEFVRSDLWQMANEINKLSNYRKGDIVKKNDVELLVKPNIENDIFKTIDALAERNKKKALLLLHKHLDNGDNALYLLSMFAYQFRNLIIVKDLSDKSLPYQVIVKKSGLHPFVAQKTYYMANQFKIDELKKIYKKIFQTDADIKTGKIEPETSIDLLLSSVI